MLPNDLDPISIRVLGSLIEKELSTPEHYPLSLNALTAACNQSSNRDPVMTLDDTAVSHAIDGLRRQGVVRSFQGIGSRVAKFSHLLNDVGDFSRADIAVLGVLMLRGPQTQAEIRMRAARLVPDGEQAGLDAALEGLVTREPALVIRLARRPGQKESRYAHLLGGPVDQLADETLPVAAADQTDRLAALEELVTSLRAEVAELRSQLAQFRKQFE